MNNTLKIGCHLSSTNGFMEMAKDATSIFANTFAFFTRNPRGGSAKNIDLNDINEFNLFLDNNSFAPLVAHAPYTLNPCSAKEEVREFAKTTFIDDIKRMELIPNNYYNLHPGSHLGQGIDVGIKQTADLLNLVMYPKMNTTILIEIMAGKGSEIGSTFEEIKSIIDFVNVKEKIGVCLDTCHIWEGGYDIKNNLDDVVKKFDDTIGLKYLKAIHLNDSKNPLGAHKDRHEKIGEGQIGIDTLVKIINHDAFCDLPFILETPNDLNGYKNEIITLRKMYKS